MVLDSTQVHKAFWKEWQQIFPKFNEFMVVYVNI